MTDAAQSDGDHPAPSPAAVVRRCRGRCRVRGAGPGPVAAATRRTDRRVARGGLRRHRLRGGCGDRLARSTVAARAPVALEQHSAGLGVSSVCGSHHGRRLVGVAGAGGTRRTDGGPRTGPFVAAGRCGDRDRRPRGTAADRPRCPDADRMAAGATPAGGARPGGDRVGPFGGCPGRAPGRRPCTGRPFHGTESTVPVDECRDVARTRAAEQRSGVRSPGVRGDVAEPRPRRARLRRRCHAAPRTGVVLRPTGQGADPGVRGGGQFG